MWSGVCVSDFGQRKKMQKKINEGCVGGTGIYNRGKSY